jgi:hypothetical protein
MLRSTKTVTAAAMLALILGGTSHAGYIVNVTEVGNDVVATGIGTIDTVDLTNQADSGEALQLASALGFATLGSGGANTYFGGVTGPAGFGAGLGLYGHGL